MRTNDEIVKNRYIGIDVVKAVAILFVVGVHFFLNTRFYPTKLDSYNLIAQLFLQQLFLICIPLFLMSTGYLNDNVDIGTKYFKKIIPIMLVYVVYSILALFYRYSFGDIEFDILLWINLILTFKANTYSWYINLYFGLFLLIPFLNRIYFSLKNKKEKKILIGIFTLLTIVSSDLLVPNYWVKTYPIAYFFIGKYFKEFRPEINKVKNIVYILIIIIFQVIIEYTFAGGGKYVKYINHYASITRSIEACLLFCLLYRININNSKVRKFVVDISNITLDIYLASYLTDKIMYRYMKTLPITQEQFFYLFIPLVSTSFLLAYAIAKTRTKLLKIENIFRINKINDKLLKNKQKIA